MMKDDLPFLTVFGLAVAVAVGALAYALGGGTQSFIAIGVAVGAAVLGQFMLMAMALRQDERRDAAIGRVRREASGMQAEFRRKADGFQAQLDAMRQQGAAQSAAVIQGISELKTSYGGLQAMLEERLANAVAPAMEPAPLPVEPEPAFYAPEEPAPEPVVAAYVPPEPEELAPPEPEADDAFADQVSFALEPVVDILTRRTAHYRMHVGMALGGEDISNDQLLHYAGRMGKRPLLDRLAAQEALELLQKLRQRDPDLCIFVTIGAETLSDAHALQALEELRATAAPHLAAGLVFELPHAMLAGLPEQALEGLASLARAGAVFALGNASLNGLDLQAMNTLNVRHVALAAGSIDAEQGPSTTLIGFAQMARLSRINLIITGMSNAQLLSKVQSVARLACGPCFAEPRRVKRRQAKPAMDLAA